MGVSDKITNHPETPLRVVPYSRGFVFRKQIGMKLGTMSKTATLFGEVVETKSEHRQLVEFFSDTALVARGFRPTISPQDAVKLKKALSKNILDHSHWEQIMLYFLADRSFKNLSPTIYTMLSSTVLNGLRNKALNREQFFKELETYREVYVNRREGTHSVKSTYHSHVVEEKKQEPRGMVSIADKLKQLQERMTKREEVRT